MKKILCGVAFAALVTSALSAQTEAQPAETTETVAEEAAPAAPAPKQDLVLNSGTPITLAVVEEVNSSTHKEGDIFKLTVLNDVIVDGVVVIPKGTPAVGEITWRTGKGAFGKSGKMEFALRSIDLKGTAIPVSGEFRQEGEGNTIATGVGVIAIGVFAGFITGKRARLPVGRELMSQLGQNVPFKAEGGLSASFDSAAAMAAADAKTSLGRCKVEANKLDKEKKREKALEECYSERME